MTASDATVWAAVFVVGLGTVALRGSFLFLFERLGTVPPRVERALGFVPAAVLAALVFPAILAPEGAVSVLGNDRLAAAAVAAAVAWYTESLLATIVVGLVAIVVIGLV
ncbi:MAG: AzlD domain-containing protein [Halobacteriales archaeon]|nr:AzlD domain-containing protein [Halobacteriales archaeon]